MTEKHFFDTHICLFEILFLCCNLESCSSLHLSNQIKCETKKSI